MYRKLFKIVAITSTGSIDFVGLDTLFDREIKLTYCYINEDVDHLLLYMSHSYKYIKKGYIT